MPVFEVPLDQSFLLKLGQPNEVIGYVPSISSGEIPVSPEHFVRLGVAWVDGELERGDLFDCVYCHGNAGFTAGPGTFVSDMVFTENNQSIPRSQ
jgi:hypothetical protein